MESTSGIAATTVAWLCCALFLLRVLGQILVGVGQAPSLPPFEAWYSGLLPYPYLVAAQLVLLVLMGAASYAFMTGAGALAVTTVRGGTVLAVTSAIYAASMIVRYVVKMWRRPEARWLGGTIPIGFHLVLALYLFTLSTRPWLTGGPGA